MSNKTRKHIWPVSLAMSIAIVGALAAFLVLTAAPGSSSAHGPDDPATHDCSDRQGAQAGIHDAFTASDHPKCVTGNGGGNGGNGNGDMGMAGDVTATGWSSSSNGSDTLTISVKSGVGPLDIDDSIILVLEDDFAVPDSIPNGVVYFRQSKGPSGGARVYASVSVDSEDDEHAGDDAHTIQIYVPDMDPADNNAEGLSTDKFTIVIPKAAGIKNPGDAKNYGIEGKTPGFKVGYQILQGTASYDDENTMPLPNVVVKPKVSLDDENNKRDYELTITGSGFNKGSSATAYVLAGALSTEQWWDSLNCEEMAKYDPMEREANMDNPYCAMYDDLGDDEMEVVQDVEMDDREDGSNICMVVVGDGESIGSDTVDNDYKVTIMTEVTGGSKGDFVAGPNNRICVRDDNSPDRRLASAAKVFDLQHSIAVEPGDVASGEEVTVKLRDYAGDYMVTNVSLDGKRNSEDDDFDITVNSSGTEITFDMPGGVSGSVEVAVETDGPSDKTATITVNPSSLDLSQSEVAPNASVIISGSGFNERAFIAVEDITIDDERLVVDDAGTVSCDASVSASKECVQVTSSGEFTATVRIWTHSSSNANPALDDDEFTIKVKDADGFEGKAKITISEPTIKVTPEMASPRDFIVISGENWPISTSEMDNSVTIEIDGRTRQADVNSTGRFRYEYQLRANIGIGDEHDVTVTYEDTVGNIKRDDIEEETTFSVVQADISVTPVAAAPGQMISVEVGGMRPYTLIDKIQIGRVSLLGNQSVTTNREGDATVSNMTVPYLDPGHYPVTVQVGNETRVVQFEMLAEAVAAGVAAQLPDAVSALGDNMVAMFYWNDTTKEWSFYDPRPEFADLNTLTEMVNGEAYWILVNETVDDVELNNKPRSLTCRGGDCWNLEVW